MDMEVKDEQSEKSPVDPLSAVDPLSLVDSLSVEDPLAAIDSEPSAALVSAAELVSSVAPASSLDSETPADAVALVDPAASADPVTSTDPVASTDPVTSADSASADPVSSADPESKVDLVPTTDPLPTVKQVAVPDPIATPQPVFKTENSMPTAENPVTTIENPVPSVENPEASLDPVPPKSPVDPSDISKDLQLIKDSQKNIGKLDVLVCGDCNEVFYFIEAFQEHKQIEGNCPKTSTLKENHKNEAKSQVWAFMLWKNAHYKVKTEKNDDISTWSIYQKWCKLEPDERLKWITAGDEIHHFTKISMGKIQELRKYARKTLTKPKLVTVSSLHSLNMSSDDPLEEGEISLNERKDSTETDPLGDVTMSSEADIEGDDKEQKGSKVGANKIDPNDLIKKAIIKPVRLNNDVTILPTPKKNISKKAIRTSKEDNKQQEYAVEKILSKRYNPKRKTFEYLIKWENFDNDQNTWEPTAHIEGCKLMIAEFEKNLQRQRELKASKANILKRAEKDKRLMDDIKLTPGGRPQRTSKQKALNQVKVWCGDISDADDSSTKRKLEDDDSDSDSFDKRLKMEDYSDSSEEEEEEEKPAVTIKRISKPAPVNGVGKKNLLVTDSQGVVRLNPKQVSSLKSGVYIMNKSKGLIKLDSNTSKIPGISGVGTTTTLQGLPKIVGQTRIKIVRRENSNNPTNVIKLNPKTSAAFMSKLDPSLKVVPKPVIKTTVSPARSAGTSNLSFDDGESSDGVEEMEFPTNEPIPPDSPPREPTLDPLTGQLLGEAEQAAWQKQIMEEEARRAKEKSAIAQIKSETNSDLKEATKEKETALVKPKNVKEKNPGEGSDSKTDNDGKELEVAKNTDTTAKATSDEGDELVKKLSEITNEVLDKVNEQANLLKENGKIGEIKKEGVSTNTLIETLSLPEITLTSSKVQATKSISSTSAVTKSTKPSILCHALTDKNSTSVHERKLLSPPVVMRHKVLQSKAPMNKQPVKSMTPVAKRYISKPITPRGKMPLTSPTPVISRISPKTYINKSNLAKKTQNRTIVSAPLSSVIETNRSPSVQSIQKTTPIRPAPAVINMPLLAAEEEEPAPEHLKIKSEEIANVATLPSTFSLTETETPLFITGDDGTIYQIAGQNEQGQTVLISQGADGQQQCLVVASESVQEINQALTNEADTSAAAEEPMMQEPLMVQTEESEMQVDNSDTQVDAQIVKAEPPSPGGTRKVLLLLPDGNLMMTELSSEQYNSLELDK